MKFRSYLLVAWSVIIQLFFNVFGVSGRFPINFCFNFWGFQVFSLILYFFWNFESSGNLNSDSMMFTRGTVVHYPPLIFASIFEVSKFAASFFTFFETLTGNLNSVTVWCSQERQRFAPQPASGTATRAATWAAFILFQFIPVSIWTLRD